MKVLSLVLLCSFVFLGSCRFSGGKRVRGNGESATEERNFSNFSGIEVSGPYDVYISQGSNYNVRIEGDENLLEYIKVETNGDELEIGNRKGYNLRPKAGIKIYVTSPRIEQLDVAGSGSIISDTKITNNTQLDINIAGSGDVSMQEIDSPEIHAEIGGSGSIKLKGRTESFFAEIAGSGEVHAFNLLSEITNVDIAGSGDAEVFASKKLDVNIVGSGDVQYKGNPELSRSKIGSGDVRKVN